MSIFRNQLIKWIQQEELSEREFKLRVDKLLEEFRKNNIKTPQPGFTQILDDNYKTIYEEPVKPFNQVLQNALKCGISREEINLRKTLDIANATGELNIKSFAVVEDDYEVLKTISEDLSNLGHHVDIYYSTVRLPEIKKLAETDYDYIISGQILENITGLELFSFISQLNTRTRFILYSEVFEVDNFENVSVFNKPFNISSLFNKAVVKSEKKAA